MIGRNIKRIATVSLAMLMVLSVIQIMPLETEIVENASAGSTWKVWDWVNTTNVSYNVGIDNVSSPGQLKLFYGRDLYVSDGANARIVKTKIDGSDWTTLDIQGFFPRGIDYDNTTGNIYGINTTGIYRTYLNGTNFYQFGTSGGGNFQFNIPYGIYYDKSEDFSYVADRSNHRIARTNYTYDAAAWSTIGSGPGSGVGQFNFLQDVHYDNSTGEQFLYIADTNNDRLVQTNWNGTNWTTFGTVGNGVGQFNRPYDIHFDNSTGLPYIFVADRWNNRIVKTQMNGSGWSSLGGPASGSGAGEFSAPYGICYDNSTDFIYIADTSNNRIVKTKIDGSGWRSIGTLGSGVREFDAPWDIDIGDNSYSSKGELISNGFSKGPNANLKTISWNATVPVNTTVQFQLRGADTEANLALKSFVGPDGTPSTNYTTSTGQAIWSGHDTEAWIQYRVAMTTTDNTVTPLVDDVTFYYNYVPAKPTLNSPANNTWTANNNPTFAWTFNDVDPGNYQTEYQIQTSNNSAFTPLYKSGNATTSNQFGSLGTFEDGALYWHVRTRDDDNDWSAYSNYNVVYIDTTDPISNVTTPANNSLLNSLPTISGTSSDSGGIGVDFVNVTIRNETSGEYWNGTAWNFSATWLAVTGTSAWSLSTNLPPWTSGNLYTIVSRATDQLNHVEVPVDWTTFGFDALAPSSAVTIPMDNSYLNALPLISGNAADTGGAGLDYVNISIEDNASGLYWNGTGWNATETWLAVTGTSSWILIVGLPAWVSGNNYTIRSRATDLVPNVEIPGGGITFYFDTDMPTSSITSPLNDTWYNSLTSIMGTALDTGGAWVDFVNITIKNETSAQYWDGADWNATMTWLAVTGTTTWSLSAGLPPWASGNTYTISSRATDIVPNVEVPGLGNTFYFDNELPNSTVTMPINNSYIESLTTIIINATDTGGSGVSTVQITIRRTSDGASWNGTDWNTTVVTWLDTSKVSITEWDYDSSTVNWTSEEWFQIRARAEDNASNSEPATDWTTFYYDDLLPSPVSITINNGSTWTNTTNVTLNLTAFDSGSGINRVAYSDNGMDWTPWEPYTQFRPYTLPPIDGSKRVHYKVEDFANNTVIVSDTIILDTTPPILVSILINDDDTYTNATRVRLTLSALDVTSDLGAMSFSTDGMVWTSWERFNVTKTFILPSGDGTKVVYYRVRDRVNNTAQTSDSIILDTTPPFNLEILINDDDVYTNSASVQLTLNATDALSGVANMAFSENGTWWTDWELFATAKPFTLTGADGMKKVYFMVQDSAGNFAVANDTIYLDRVAPDPVTITINDDDTYTNLEIVSLGLFAEDTGSGLNRMAFSTDNVVWSAWESYGTSKSFTLPTGDGPKTVYFKVEDMALNSATASDSITLDTEPPIDLSIVINDDAQYTNSMNVELALSADDITSGVYQMAFSTDGSNWTAWEPYNTSKAYTLSTGDGPKVVYFKVRDMVNNTAIVPDTIVLDTAAPDPISIVINDGDANTNSASVTLTLSASDSGSDVSEMAFSTNNVDWTSWEAFGTTKAFTLENVDGLQTAYLRVNDNAGNIGTATDTITLDTTPPHSLSITINGGDTETDEVDVSLALAALDATTSVRQMAFSTDNTTWTTWENFTATKNYTLSTGDGLKTIYFKVDDLVGNEALPVYATITLKTEPEVTDTDGDTYPDDQDAFPNDPNEWEDTDEDGTGDNADTDDDEDGYLDEWEDFLGTEPKDPTSVPPDHDSDFEPDGDADNSMPWMDTDDDDDGYSDAEEKEKGTDPLNNSDYPTEKKKKDDAEDYSLYLIILVIIIVIVILALAVSRRGKGEEEPEEALAEEEGEAEEEEEGEEEEDEEDFECPTCGAPLKASDTVCTECGEEFEDEDEEE